MYERTEATEALWKSAQIDRSVNEIMVQVTQLKFAWKRSSLQLVLRPTSIDYDKLHMQRQRVNMRVSMVFEIAIYVNHVYVTARQTSSKSITIASLVVCARKRSIKEGAILVNCYGDLSVERVRYPQ